MFTRRLLLFPNIADLGLGAESTPQVDWDAPEAGTAPPQVGPGMYTFLFKMPEVRADWFDSMEVEVVPGQPKRKFLVLQYEAQVQGDKDGVPYPAPEDGSQLPTLRYQRASFYKSDKMLISQGAELLRAVGIRITGPLTPEAVQNAVEGVEGRATFKGDVAWRAYFKDTETTVSTNPRKKTKKGPDLPWPKAADGSFELSVGNPKNPNDQKQYGRAEITRVHAGVGAASA